MEIGGYFGIARRWWKVLVLAVALAAGGGYAVGSGLPKVYEGEARVLVGPLNTDFDTQRAAGQLANTYAQLATSRSVAEAVVRKLGVPISPDALQEATNAIPNDVTRLVIIRVQDGDPARAAALANAVADEIETLAAASQRPEGQTTLIDPAVAPRTPVAPQVILLVLLAAFAGFLAAISLIVLIEYTRDAVRSEEDVRDLSGRPILGNVSTRLDPSLDVATAILGRNQAEAYRALTARVEHTAAGRRIRSVLVAGLHADGQAGVVASGLALAFADRGVAVALVDGDPDLDVAAALGLSESSRQPPPDARTVQIARVRAAVDDAEPTRRRIVSLLVAPGSGPDVVRAEQLRRMIGAIQKEAAMTVVAAPAVDRSSEALLWAGVTDAVVLVVAIPGSRRRAVRDAVDALQVTGKRFVGLVVTDAPKRGYKFPAPDAELREGLMPSAADPERPGLDPAR